MKKALTYKTLGWDLVLITAIKKARTTNSCPNCSNTAKSNFKKRTINWCKVIICWQCWYRF